MDGQRKTITGGKRMREPELFWGVYKNLEEETLRFARYIHFSSDQKKVYSMSIADVIVRCAIEIEAISKKIYGILGGNMHPQDENGKERDLYFDTDCLALIENTYHLSKKEIIISASSFYFEDADCAITPLNKAYKRGTSGSKWKQAYQALKHDRYGKLKSKATVENLLNSLGALYILNLYYRDKVYPLKNDFTSFDARVDSEIFSVHTYDATNISIPTGQMDDSCIHEKNGDNIDHAIYVIKCTDECFSALHKALRKDNEEMFKNIMNHPGIKQYLSIHPQYEFDDLHKLVIDALGPEAIGQFVSIKNLHPLLATKQYEAVINHGKNIYPTLP